MCPWQALAAAGDKQWRMMAITASSRCMLIHPLQHIVIAAQGGLEPAMSCVGNACCSTTCLGMQAVLH